MFKSKSVRAYLSPAFLLKISGVVVVLIFSIEPGNAVAAALAAETQHALYNIYTHGQGAMQGNIYTPASPAIDIRNINGSTFDTLGENAMIEKYVFMKPYPHSTAVYRRERARSSQYGLVAVFDNSFQEEGYIQVDVSPTAAYAEDGCILNLSGNRLINYAVPEASSLPQRSPHHPNRTVVKGHTVKKVMDNVVNMQGIKQATSAVQQDGVITLTAPKQPGPAI